MIQTANPVTLLASPLGEEGHEVAKGCTRVRMIMILDVDVTAERRHYNTHRPKGATTTLGAKGPVKLKNPPAQRPVKPKNLFAQPFYTTCGIRRVPLCPKGGKIL